MPKIVDHEDYKKELATNAAGYFSKHGYAGVGMRGIAEHLGVSKSALYHYFPTKEALFLASTETIMGRVGENVFDAAATEEEQIQALVDSMKSDFGAEMILVFEYLRGKSAQEIAADEAMRLSLATFLGAIERIVGAERAVETLERVVGRLMLDYLSGGEIEAIKKDLGA